MTCLDVRYYNFIDVYKCICYIDIPLFINSMNTTGPWGEQCIEPGDPV